MLDPAIIHITKRLRQIAHELDKHSKYIQENYRITIPQLICLHEIYHNGPISFVELTKTIFLNSSTVTGIIDRLEKRGLVRRTRLSSDRRKIHIEITEKGIDFLEKAPAPLQQRFIDQFQAFDKDEEDRMLWAIDELVSLLQLDEKTGQKSTAYQG